jgi:hypothetical protein
VISVRPSSGVSQAADRAGALIAEQIRAMLEAAETRAGEIREMTERDARTLRDTAVADAAGLIEFLEALEHEIDEIVKSIQREVDHLHASLAKRARGTSLDSGSRPHPADERRRADEPEGPADEPEKPAAPEPDVVSRDTAAVVEEQPATAEPVTTSEPADAEEPAPNGQGVFSRLRRRKEGRPFVDVNGQCEVCGRSYRASSEEQLYESGWQVTGEKGCAPNA